MGYSPEVLNRARRVLEDDRTQAIREHHKRLTQAYIQVPRLKAIDDMLRRSMVLAVQAAFAKGDEAKQIMDDAKQANLALQQERKALISQNFPADWLEEKLCPHCSGTGYVGSTMCSCLDTICRREQKKEVSLLSCGVSDFQDFRLDYYPDRTVPNTNINIRAVMAKTLETCRQYAADFPNVQGNLLFSGDTGLGKTFLAACIAGTVTDKGYSVAYESASHLFSHMEKARFSTDPEQKAAAEAHSSKYMSCDLLIIDDLGTELSGQFVTNALYCLINDRLLENKATIISTNLKNDDMEKRYSPQILSRLRGTYRRVTFVGDDIRVEKNRGNLK